MHDPMTMAFEIKNPFVKPSESGWRPSLITIWHVDPETDGSDDSCDWFYFGLTESERMAALDLVTNEVDNLLIYVRSMDKRDVETVLFAQWRKARQFHNPRSWWKHPRWHIHHWRIQVHPVQQLRRWLFTRCERCGKRFPYGYSPVSSGNYIKAHGFHGERSLYHHDCYQIRVAERNSIHDFVETLDIRE